MFAPRLRHSSIFPPELLDDYLAEMARVLDGWLFVTVPNEKGILFLSKYLIQKFVLRSAEPYKFSEIVNATLGRMEKITRREHKGFDYMALIDQIGQHFDVQSIESIPFRILPKWAAFTIGIVAKSRPRVAN